MLGDQVFPGQDGATRGGSNSSRSLSALPELRGSVLTQALLRGAPASGAGSLARILPFLSGGTEILCSSVTRWTTALVP